MIDAAVDRYNPPPVRRPDVIRIDGSDGGGGVLRTALGFAIATGRPVQVDDVRGDRPNPGLKPQHVACVDAACAVADGRASTDERGLEAIDDGNAAVDTGADTVVFEPGPVTGGTHDVDVGTAGSATLVATTVLPAALVADGTVRLRIDGGTDVAWSPPADYLAGVTLPVLRAHGLAAAVDTPRRGFYPAGGGRLDLTLGPSTPRRLGLALANAPNRGTVERVDVAAVASADLLDANVADRMAREAATRLDEYGVPVGSRAARYADTDSTGAVVTLRVARGIEDRVDRGDDDTTADGSAVPVAGFSALGEQGVPAETIANRAVSGLERWGRSPGVVDARLADQLVPWLALVGGTVRVPSVTDHVASAVAVARAFDRPIDVDDGGAPHDGVLLVGPS